MRNDPEFLTASVGYHAVLAAQPVIGNFAESSSDLINELEEEVCILHLRIVYLKHWVYIGSTVIFLQFSLLLRILCG